MWKIFIFFYIKNIEIYKILIIIMIIIIIIISIIISIKVNWIIGTE